MTQVDFFYNGSTIRVQCNKSDIVRNILYKFAAKANININSVYLIYAGNIISNQNLTLDQIATSDDKVRNKMNILVQDQTNISLISQSYTDTQSTLNSTNYQAIPTYQTISPHQIIPTYQTNYAACHLL